MFFLKKSFARKETIRFVLTASIFMALFHILIPYGEKNNADENTRERSALAEETFVEKEQRVSEAQKPNFIHERKSLNISVDDKFDDASAWLAMEDELLSGEEDTEQFSAFETQSDTIFDMKAKSAVVEPSKRSGKIAIIIDDLGMNVPNSEAIINMGYPMTLALLPYAENIDDMADRAKEKGHELIIHMPMEPMNKNLDLGPVALKTGMEEEDFIKNFETALESFEGYAGMNNHMGSRLTQDVGSVDRLMRALDQHDLFFIDSKTIHSSVIVERAEMHGVPYAVRDVFLDHEETLEFAENMLQKTENLADKYGQAIAIGHPKDITIEALTAWLPTLEEKGFELVPAGELLRHPEPSMILASIDKIETASGEDVPIKISTEDLEKPETKEAEKKPVTNSLAAELLQWPSSALQ